MLTYFMDARGKQRECHFLYHAIRRDILARKLLPGERLPSKRAFAEYLGLGLSTVGSAYATLLDESYLEVKARSGFSVSTLTTPENGSVTPATTADFQSTDAVVTSAPATSETENTAPRTFLGDLSADFPFTPFSHIARNVLLRFPNELLTHPGNQGVLHFRAAINAYLLRYHGTQAEPAQIVIGSDTEYLYGLVTQLLPHVALYDVEAQSYEKARLVYSAYARPYELLPLNVYEVGADGLASSHATLLHVTPHQSFPNGVTANTTKHFEYFRWVKERTAFPMKDSYASELSFQKEPLETIHAMDSNDSVIYLNTFTKTLVPSMCVTYMVLPKHLLEGCRERLGFYACIVPALNQCVLVKYVSRGYLERRPNQIRRKLRLARQDSRTPLPEVSSRPPQSGSAN